MAPNNGVKVDPSKKTLCSNQSDALNRMKSALPSSGHRRSFSLPEQVLNTVVQCPPPLSVNDEDDVVVRKGSAVVESGSRDKKSKKGGSSHSSQLSWDSSYGNESGIDVPDCDDGRIFETYTSGSKAGKSFCKHFPSMIEMPINHANFSCSLIKESVPWHGRLFLTPSYICFNSKIFKKQVVIPFKEVIAIKKEKTAFIVPNSIKIVTSFQKMSFGSLFHRDSTFKIMTILWARNCEKKPRLDLLSATTSKITDQEEEINDHSLSFNTDTSFADEDDDGDGNELHKSTKNQDGSLNDIDEIANDDDDDQSAIYFNRSCDKSSSSHSASHRDGEVVGAKGSSKTGQCPDSATIRYRPSAVVRSNNQCVTTSSQNSSKSKNHLHNESIQSKRLSASPNDQTLKPSWYSPVLDKNNNSTCAKIPNSSPALSPMPDLLANHTSSKTGISKTETASELMQYRTNRMRSSSCDLVMSLMVVLLLVLSSISILLLWRLQTMSSSHHDTSGAYGAYDYVSAKQPPSSLEQMLLNDANKVQTLLQSCAMNQATIDYFINLLRIQNELLQNLQVTLNSSYKSMAKNSENISRLIESMTKDQQCNEQDSSPISNPH